MDTIAKIFEAIAEGITFILGVFGDVLDTMTDNPLLFIPIVIALSFAVIKIAIKVVRKFGVRGAR